MGASSGGNNAALDRALSVRLAQDHLVAHGDRAGRAVSKASLDADLLNPREVESLITACSSRAPTGIRNRALIAIAWRSGLRIGEVLALQTKDIDLASGKLTVQHGKGDKRRVVGMDPGTAALVERWLSVRRQRGLRASAPAFCTLAGGQVDQSYIRHLLPRLARKAGVAKRVHAHALRHAYAVELEREGASVSAIRDLLGHSSLAVTDGYLRRLGATEAIAFSQNRTWRMD
jgi:site-specific recombinase XerD